MPEPWIPVTLLGDAFHPIALPPMPWWVAEAMCWRMELPWPNHYGTTILLQLGRRFVELRATGTVTIDPASRQVEKEYGS